MNSENVESYTAYIGIDWADKKHDICIQSDQLNNDEYAVVSNKIEEVDAWALDMYKRFGAPIAVAVELTKGPIVYALQKYDFFVIHPVNPTTLAKYRQAFKPSRAKDDPTDALLAVELIRHYPDKFKPLKPQSKEIRALFTLTEHRRKLVGDRVRLTNRIRYAVKQYYPQILEWFDRIDTMVFCDFLERWPTAAQARRARRSTLTNFFHSYNIRRADLLKERLNAIKRAEALTEDDGVVIPHRLQALVLVDQLLVTLAAIKRYDDQIAELAENHVDYKLFDCLPGAGPSLAPRLLVAFGEDRERFSSASKLQMYSGIAPVTERSGKKCWVHWRWSCPTFLRQTFTEWASQTINKSFWAGAFYRQQRDKGCTHQAAVRSLAYKWIRILYRCWVTRTPYNESVYLKTLKRRGSPLMNQVAESVGT